MSPSTPLAPCTSHFQAINDTTKAGQQRGQEASNDDDIGKLKKARISFTNERKVGG